jgi:hypothetical protein
METSINKVRLPLPTIRDTPKYARLSLPVKRDEHRRVRPLLANLDPNFQSNAFMFFEVRSNSSASAPLPSPVLFSLCSVLTLLTFSSLVSSPVLTFPFSSNRGEVAGAWMTSGVQGRRDM